jgi:hypothetical protein
MASRVWKLVVRLRATGDVVSSRYYYGPNAVALAVNAAGTAGDHMDVVCALTSCMVK